MVHDFQVHKRIPAAKWNAIFQECFPYVVKSSLFFYKQAKKPTTTAKKQLRGKNEDKKGEKNQIASKCLKIN